MSREIKFRAWDRNDGMLYAKFDFLGFDAFASHKVQGKLAVILQQEPHDSNGDYKEDPNPSWEGLIWMQYTGLQDKNGKDIYEGDILRGEVSFKDDNPLITHALAVVVWFQADCQFHLVDTEEYVLGNLDEPAYILDDRKGWPSLEIVGNIYETPELLEAK